MRKIATFLLVFVMLLGFVMPTTTTVQASGAEWETAMNRSLDWIRSAVSPNPVVGSVGGRLPYSVRLGMEYTCLLLSRGAFR